MVTSLNSADLILQAAIDCVDVDGAAGLRVDVVANRAGLNKRMIYHYFSDRTGLLAGVYRSQVALLLHNSSALSEPSRRVLQALLKLAASETGGEDWLAEYPAGENPLGKAPSGDAHLSKGGSAGQAARIVMPWLLQTLGHTKAKERVQLGLFATELMALALPIAAASDQPTKLETQPYGYHGVSERLHAEKPVFRVASKSRPRAIPVRD